MTKKWFKFWVAESLRGSIRFDLTSEERGVWYDLLAMAADGRHEGYIAPNTEQGYPDAWIAATLNISIKLLKRVISKCEVTDRLERTRFGLHIANWSRYQSEYDRQKPYRQKTEKELDEEYDRDNPLGPEEAALLAEPYIEDEFAKGKLVRGDTPIEVHEAAILKANPHAFD